MTVKASPMTMPTCSPATARICASPAAMKALPLRFGDGLFLAGEQGNRDRAGFDRQNREDARSDVLAQRLQPARQRAGLGAGA